MEDFEVLYKPRTIIKGQALVDFIVKFTYIEEPVEEPPLPDLPLELHVSILT